MSYFVESFIARRQYLQHLRLKYGQAVDQAMDSRQKTNEVTDKFMAEFIEENGSYMCKELLGYDLSTQEGIAENILKQ